MALHLHCASATAGRLDEVLIMLSLSLSLVDVQKCPAFIQRRQRRRHMHWGEGEGALLLLCALTHTIVDFVFGVRTSDVVCACVPVPRFSWLQPDI